MAADARSAEARIARLEACFGRLDERMNADRDSRKEWRDEVGRRLGELNNHSAELSAERSHFMPKETGEAQLAALQNLLEARSLEFAREGKGLLETLDRKLDAHEVVDDTSHRDHEQRMKTIEEWISNQKGRQWAVGVAVTLGSGAVGAVVSVLFHLLGKK